MSVHVFWETREGRKVRVADMTDRHLAMAVRMLERRVVPLLMSFLRDRACFVEVDGGDWLELVWMDPLLLAVGGRAVAERYAMYEAMRRELERRDADRAALEVEMWDE